jgi:teichuronic acid biosynthesis glycosyltransferase TuaG
MKPSVSVVMPLYNSAAFMAESVESVIHQTFPDFELILVDDCSTDNTLAVARGFAEADGRIRIVAQSANGGACAARNAGISAARGRYIAFLDSDDLWKQDKLAVQISGMQQKDAAFSYTDYIVTDEHGAVIRLASAPEKMSYRDLLKNTAIGCSTVIYDSDRIGKQQFPSIRKHEDLALWLSILRDIDYAHRCGPAMTFYRVRPGSLSSDKLKAASYTWEIYRKIEGLPLPAAAYYFSRYALSAVRRRLFRKTHPGT